MDPVAAQFLDQLDQATDVLPASVHAGLVMCGSDAAPGLVERLRDTERALPTRVFSALVLADQKVPEGWAAMVDVIAGGAVVLLPSLGRLLSAGGEGAAEAAMTRAEDPTLLAEIRLVLAGLAVRAAGAQWAAERVSKVAIATFEEAPAPALQLMRMAPHPSYGEVLRAHPERLRADPESALEVLLADAPDAEAAALVRALSTGLESAMDSVLETLASAGLSTGPDDV